MACYPTIGARREIDMELISQRVVFMHCTVIRPVFWHLACGFAADAESMATLNLVTGLANALLRILLLLLFTPLVRHPSEAYVLIEWTYQAETALVTNAHASVFRAGLADGDLFKSLALWLKHTRWLTGFLPSLSCPRWQQEQHR